MGDQENMPVIVEAYFIGMMFLDVRHGGILTKSSRYVEVLTLKRTWTSLGIYQNLCGCRVHDVESKKVALSVCFRTSTLRFDDGWSVLQKGTVADDISKRRRKGFFCAKLELGLRHFRI